MKSPPYIWLYVVNIKSKVVILQKVLVFLQNLTLMGWLLDLGLKEDLLECKTACIKSVVILTATEHSTLLHRLLSIRFKSPKPSTVQANSKFGQVQTNLDKFRHVRKWLWLQRYFYSLHRYSGWLWSWGSNSENQWWQLCAAMMSWVGRWVELVF